MIKRFVILWNNKSVSVSLVKCNLDDKTETPRSASAIDGESYRINDTGLRNLLASQKSKFMKPSRKLSRPNTM